MKNWSVILLLSLLTILEVAECVRDFSVSGTIDYFVEQPLRLVFVAAIGMVGGMAAFLFYRLPSWWQRGVTLLALGSAATSMTLVCVYVAYEFGRLSFAVGYYTFPLGLIFSPVCAAALLLWLKFYQAVKSRVACPDVKRAPA